MNVLSTFDGMSCGQIALDQLGIKYDNYFASEIDKYAMQITQKNYPNTIQVGDIKKLYYENNLLKRDGDTIDSFFCSKIDLLIGGSPCQNLSHTVINNIKNNQGLQGEKSSLFFEYLRLLIEIKPKYFLLENVGSMSKANLELINYAMGVDGIMIDSKYFSAQDRKRYYWTNIPFDKNIVDKGIMLKDIVLDGKDVEDKYWYKQDFIYNGDNTKVQATLNINGHDILKRVNNINNKSATLTCCRGGNLQKKIFQIENK